MNRKGITHIEASVAIRQIRLIDDYLVKDFIRPLTDNDIKTIITQKSWSRIKTVEGAVRKFRKQAIERMQIEHKRAKELEKIRTCYICKIKDQTRNMFPVNYHSQYDPPSDHSPFICRSEKCANLNYEVLCGRISVAQATKDS
tara:strand:- start:55 stop:483 length:429 start_codon:yes stop_codon:yes gene_type:complete